MCDKIWSLQLPTGQWNGMDPLQHFVAPRRPLPSPRSKAKDGASRNVFALPVIHQFEPVLASSPKSYMVNNANATKGTKSSDGVGSPPVAPSQPQRPRSKEGVESPRVLRPQPPTGVSSRTDVDIYRYSQGTEQRMAIRPLFEQRRGSEGAKRKVKRGKKKEEDVSVGEDSAGGGQEDVDVGDRDVELKTKSDGDEVKCVHEENEVVELSSGASNQEDLRANSPAPDDCVGASVADVQDLRKQEEDPEFSGEDTAYVENGILSTLRHFQQQEAVHLNVAAFMQQAASSDSEAAFNDRVEQNLEAAKMAKLSEIAILSIIDDMILDFIAYECRVEIHAAKYSGGYDDHYASKLQAAYRMSAQKKSYDHKRHVRMRAAQMLQALQRGIIARRRYSEMKVEREKYLFYGFRSSLYHATANMKDPRLRAQELSTEAERRRHAFLMQVIQGYVAENYINEDFRVSAQLVRDIYNEYGVVVGCSTNFGDIVASYLGKAPDQALYVRVGDFSHDSDAAAPPRQYSISQVSAALLLGLRDQYDDTFGLSSSARLMSTGIMQRPRRGALDAGDSAPPRWMLKTSLSFQQANLDRVAGLRLTRKAAGKQSAHLIARDYRNTLASSFDSFDSCRATWAVDIQSRQEQQRMLDSFSVDELTQYCLDLLISCVKDWGIDPDPLFEAVNLCGRHCHGKTAIRIVEEKFNAYAAKMNEVHGKQCVLTLREEISQELEDFEKLLALRILNIAVDQVITVPTSELLHIMLKGNLDEEYIRHGLPSVLPIASITEKYELTRKMLYGYANASYGDAFNLVCWSCLDVAENVTVEAARLLDKLTRPMNETGDAHGSVTIFSSNSMSLQPTNKTLSRSSESLVARALYLLTGSQAVRFLQFLSEVAHFNKSIQKRVLTHLAPYADKFEMHRLASSVCSIEDFSIVSQLFDECFSEDTLRSSMNSAKIHSKWTEPADGQYFEVEGKLSTSRIYLEVSKFSSSSNPRTSFLFNFRTAGGNSFAVCMRQVEVEVVSFWDTAVRFRVDVEITP
ncbi:hypothetical protein PF007_g6019 [Phytophthora fragariae]|uniref:Uncharacterized protein n=1 Tax=Phytophthora fragariae TaxID=53985 RepID=A0A6A4EE05_9STRA|nr:hypothetical protein PF007_g6019 [Phytophthora fragariae]KAE9320874.1 hypothetical protein PF001_g5196 [Phytophthora fragariae]